MWMGRKTDKNTKIKDDSNAEQRRLKQQIFGEIESYVRNHLKEEWPDMELSYHSSLMMPSSAPFFEESIKESIEESIDECSSIQMNSVSDEDTSCSYTFSIEEELSGGWGEAAPQEMKIQKRAELPRPAPAPKPLANKMLITKELEDLLREKEEKTFSELLMEYMIKKDLQDKDVYRAVNMDRKLFNKIKNSRDSIPKKKNVLAICIGMRLNLDETVDLLSCAGMAFSPYSAFDMVLKAFIVYQIYDIAMINEYLYSQDLEVI